MIAFAQNFSSKPSPRGVDPSMDGSEDYEVLVMADYLTQHAPLGLNGQEAIRMANAQQPEFRATTMRKAVEIAMRELLMELKTA